MHKSNDMLGSSSNPLVQQISEYAAWLVAIFLVAFGFRHARDIISYVLEQLYDVFIQQNRSAI
jgi:hypothetical protein